MGWPPYDGSTLNVDFVSLRERDETVQPDKTHAQRAEMALSVDPMTG